MIIKWSNNICYYREDIFKCILNEPLKVSKKVSPFASDFLHKILCKDPANRLGANGVLEIMSHPFFEDIDWEKLERREIKPPYVPKVKKEDDVKYIADNWLDEGIDDSPELGILTKTEKKEKYIQDFSFCEDSLLQLTKWASSDEIPLE